MLFRHFLIKFTGHCIRMPTDETTNYYFLLWIQDHVNYSTKDDISQSIFVPYSIWRENAQSLRKMAMKKYEWSQIFVVSWKKEPRDRSSQLDSFESNDDDDDLIKNANLLGMKQFTRLFFQNIKLYTKLARYFIENWIFYKIDEPFFFINFESFSCR